MKTTIEIRETLKSIQSEQGGTTQYDALNCSGEGKLVAVVTGNFEVSKCPYGTDEIKLDGYTWALRDILSLARQGERGLSIA